MRGFICLAMLAAFCLAAMPVSAAGSAVHHMVLFKLKPNVSPKQINEMKTVGEALLSRIPGVLDVSINAKARQDRKVHIKDYDLGMYVKWQNNKAGDTYGPHILHQSF